MRIHYQVNADQKISELGVNGPTRGTEFLHTDATSKLALSEVFSTYTMSTTYSATTPASPSSGVSIYASAKGRLRPAWIGPSGISNSFQSLVGRNKIGFWSATGNSIAAFNTAAGSGAALINFPVTLGGTSVARSVSPTNLFLSTKRWGVQATTAISIGSRHTAVVYSRQAGFEYIARFGISSLGSATTRRLAVGMVGTTSLQSLLSASLAGCLITFTPTNNTLSVSTSQAGGTAATTTAIPNANLPANTANVDLYEVRWFCPPAGTTMYWRIERLNTGHVAEGEVSQTLPPLTTLMSPQITFTSTGGTPGTSAIDMVSQYIETDL